MMARANAIPTILICGIVLLSVPLTFGQAESKPVPQWLKPRSSLDSRGTAEAVPFQNKTAAATPAQDKTERKAEQKTEDPQKVFATQCGVDLDGAAVHVFVNSAKGWNEYHDIKNLPDLSSGSDSEFMVRSDPSGKHYVRTFIPGDDFDRYQDDCFGEKGNLQSFRYELRTAWGWGYEESRTFTTSGKMLDKSSRFFDTRNEKTIQPPERAKEVSDAMKPEVHTEFLDMPFIPFLNE